jgi:hypothetical protein
MVGTEADPTKSFFEDEHDDEDDSCSPYRPTFVLTPDTRHLKPYTCLSRLFFLFATSDTNH